jgi:hypothetical protein
MKGNYAGEARSFVTVQGHVFSMVLDVGFIGLLTLGRW